MKKPICLFLAPLLMASSAWAGFDIVSHEANLSQGSGKTTFSITFDQALDLSTFDESGSAARQFQVFVFGDQGQDYPNNYSSIFRTAEDASTGNNVVVRAPSPLNDTEAEDPLSGGWGRILAIAPMTTQGNTVSFTLNNRDFNLFGNEGFQYRIEGYEFGELTASTETTWSKVTPIPEAGTGVQFMLGGALMLAAIGRMKATKASAASLDQ